MTETITVRGFAGTTPELRISNAGTEVTTFRLASTPRWLNQTTGDWTSGETNWYSVVAFGPFAENIAESISKGDPVVVLGRPKIRHWENLEKGTSGTEVEISAKSVGHDLKLGRSRFTKVNRNPEEAERTGQDPEAQPSAGEPTPDQEGAGESRPQHSPAGTGIWDKTPEPAGAPF